MNIHKWAEGNMTEMFLKEVYFAHQGYIYLIINKQ